jgi:hypothetical protein
MYNFNDDSEFYSRSDILGSHAKRNPIYNSIKVCTKTRLGLDYNSSWDEAPSPEKCHAVALEIVSGAGRRNELSPKMF